VTHPKVFIKPTPVGDALAFAGQLRDQPNCVPLQPGPRHWDIFRRLCLESGVKGNLVPDAYLAALAIESGSEWITTDRDFSRFKDLRWRYPLA
ncbi:MAG: type II toxin-antitoxin system VapC family toxin, partial [Burkholderiales bacterium]